MAENNETTQTQANAAERIEQILAHLKVEGTNIDLDKIRTLFNQLWNFEKADKLEELDQYLTLVALFIYSCHNVLDDYNINMIKAREIITAALTDWKAPEVQKQVEEERATDNPFKTFVEKNVSRIDEIFTWRYFQLNTKKADEKEWNYKMKSCWFSQFFIRFGRADFIATACNFDKIPAEARTDYADLKLSNTFAKLGNYCQFRYTPAKKDS